MSKTFVLDIDEIKSISKEISIGSWRFQKAFEEIKRKVLDRYGIKLPDYVCRLSRDMYHSVEPTSPYIMEFIVKMITDKIAKEYENLVIKNPNGIYNLCAGLGSSSIHNNSEFKLANIVVEGDVGTFYGGLSANRHFFHHIKGCAGRSFIDNAQQGKAIVDGIADDSAAQVNHGAYFLFKGTVGPRLGWGQRGGGIVTLENLPFNAGLFMSGGSILTLGDKVEDELGPDMQEGRIYSPKVDKNNLGVGSSFAPLSHEDYPRIADVLNPFIEELQIRIDGEVKMLDTGIFNEEHPKVEINGKIYDFSKYLKIMPARLIGAN